jgi:dihydropteroate synthase
MSLSNRIMGVMNITPNSFSDGGNQFQVDTCLQKLIELAKSSSIIDVGAESTAPMNQSITLNEELDRLKDIFLPALIEFHRQNNFFPEISLDTYKLQTIDFMAVELNRMGLKKLVWNDVSGIVDHDVLKFLKEHKNIDYVFCHNLVPSRDLTGLHKTYANETIDIYQDVSDRFLKTIKLFQENGLSDRLWLDPCFGFAKTRDQNYQLISRLPELVSSLPHQKWVIGLSKKSFLSFSNKKDDFLSREMVHFSILRHFLSIFSNEKILYRVHDPSLVLLAEQTKNLF